MRNFFLIIFLCCGIFLSSAQHDQQLNTGYWHAAQPYDSLDYSDTTLQGFGIENVLTNRWWFDLGYPGSPVRSIKFSPGYYTGINLGFRGFEPYLSNPDSFRYFTSPLAFTHAEYIQGQNQENGIIKAAFGRRFKDKLYFSIDYTRYNNLGDYQRQMIRNTALGAGFAYRAQKFTSSLSYHTNSVDQENNGGVQDVDSLFEGVFAEERLNIPVKLESAESEYDQKNLSWINTLKLLQRDARSFRANYVSTYTLEKYRFTDPSPSPSDDSLYYRSFYSEEISVFNSHKRWSNKILLTFTTPNILQNIETGLEHRYNWITRDSSSFNRQGWFLHGGFGWNISEVLHVDSEVEAGISDEEASFLWISNLKLDLENLGVLRGKFILNRRQASVLDEAFTVSGAEIYRNDFSPEVYSTIRADYFLPVIQLQLSGAIHFLDGYIYYNEERIPVQETDPIGISTLSISKVFEFGSFLNEVNLLYQESGNNPIFVPRLTFQNIIAFRRKIFNRSMLLKTGLDLRYRSGMGAVGYFPVTGQYHNMRERDLDNSFRFDFFAAFKVNLFRGFILIEHLDFLLTDKVHYETLFYPQQDLTFRFGISWHFVN